MECRVKSRKFLPSTWRSSSLKYWEALLFVVTGKVLQELKVGHRNQKGWTWSWDSNAAGPIYSDHYVNYHWLEVAEAKLKMDLMFLKTHKQQKTILLLGRIQTGSLNKLELGTNSLMARNLHKTATVNVHTNMDFFFHKMSSCQTDHCLQNAEEFSNLFQKPEKWVKAKLKQEPPEETELSDAFQLLHPDFFIQALQQTLASFIIHLAFQRWGYSSFTSSDNRNTSYTTVVWDCEKC